MWQALLLILVGVLASASFIVSKKPNAKAYLNILSPFQGLIGIAAFVGGIIILFRTLFRLSYISRLAGFWKFVYFGSIFISIVLGALLGYKLLSAVLFRSEEKKAKAEKVRKGLTKIQVPLGIISIAMGILYLVLYIVF